MENLIDLTSERFQGCIGHDIVDALKEPGYYRLPLRDYDLEDKYSDLFISRVKALGYERWWEAPKEVQDNVDKELEAEGKLSYRKVNVHIDKVIFTRGGGFQLIHTADPNIFTESDWAYYNGAEGLWKYCISVEEIADELFEEYGDEALEVAKKYHLDDVITYVENLMNDSDEDSDDDY